MAPHLSLGIVLTLIAGLMSGNCMLPMKFSRSWQWEHIWLVFSIVSLLILPWALALMLVDQLFVVYRGLSLADIAVPFLFGAGWGIAQILFGISVRRLGLGLAYAIIVGLGTVLGTLVPLLVQHGSQVSTHALIEVFAGVVAMIVGIALSSWAGQIRDRDDKAASQSSSANRYGSAVLMAIVCGLMAPMLNFSFAFGQQIAERAVSIGNSAPRAAYAVWPVGLLGGFLPNILYSLYLLQRNRSWKGFGRTATDAFLPTYMGILWMGAFALYGMSAAYLGTLGTSVGWGLFQIFMILTATLSGVLTGEWSKASGKSKMLLAPGLLCLVCATTLLAVSNR
ncbi:L-rhamnose/proton symporter RhaT [Acidicapsa dinghuensis]|uniref:L-rhamnose/proton symporter RhaT n=1 Tax=Acidicapsa dinghuensis TaxID=2218256 RepID=A0ABW1ECY6_9BACT|nr:L-rhamnose/proton symporter RhaT [Acidicapsa dinghuensis]